MSGTHSFPLSASVSCIESVHITRTSLAASISSSRSMEPVSTYSGRVRSSSLTTCRNNERVVSVSATNRAIDSRDNASFENVVRTSKGSHCNRPQGSASTLNTRRWRREIQNVVRRISNCSAAARQQGAQRRDEIAMYARHFGTFLSGGCLMRIRLHGWRFTDSVND